VNGDGTVNAPDLSAVRMHFGADLTVADNAKHDIVSDGAINALDLSYCRIQFTHTAPYTTARLATTGHGTTPVARLLD
ncbi:MAG: hypothetical protein GTO22_26735, partial [Gemmatimonadales bacterium]|nr:hypothetical protein [Gemmatimonadales bacterium]